MQLLPIRTVAGFRFRLHLAIYPCSIGVLLTRQKTSNNIGSFPTLSLRRLYQMVDKLKRYCYGCIFLQHHQLRGLSGGQGPLFL